MSLYPVIKLPQPTQRLTCCNSPVKLTSWPWSFYDSLLELHELNFRFGFRCYSTFTTATENCIQGFTICCKWLFIDRVRQSFVWFSFMSAAECHSLCVNTKPFLSHFSFSQLAEYVLHNSGSKRAHGRHGRVTFRRDTLLWQAFWPITCLLIRHWTWHDIKWYEI